MTFVLDLQPTDLNINMDLLLIQDYLPTTFEASGAKHSWVISCTTFMDINHPTDRLTDQHTDRHMQSNMPLLFQRGHTNLQKLHQKKSELQKRCKKKRVKNLTKEWNQKLQYYIPHTSKSLLCIRFEEVFWRRGPPVIYFCTALDPSLDGSGRKTTTLARDHEHFIPTKFRKNPSSGSVVRAAHVIPYINMH